MIVISWMKVVEVCDGYAVLCTIFSSVLYLACLCTCCARTLTLPVDLQDTIEWQAAQLRRSTTLACHPSTPPPSSPKSVPQLGPLDIPGSSSPRRATGAVCSETPRHVLVSDSPLPVPLHSTLHDLAAASLFLVLVMSGTM